MYMIIYVNYIIHYEISPTNILASNKRMPIC